MVAVSPFRAYRPTRELVKDVASPPYDVLTRDEARAQAENNPLSFLHVTRPEIDLPASLPSHNPKVYQHGAERFRELLKNRVLVQDPSDYYYIYRLTLGVHVQTGIGLLASVADYEQGVVRKHEHTRPAKERDRVEHMDAVGAQTGLVFLIHRHSPRLHQVVRQECVQAPAVDFIAPDGVQHQLWVVESPLRIKAITASFEAMETVYIADGHHRAAAATRVAAENRRLATKEAPGWQHIVAVSFPESEVRILPYHRVIKDLGRLTAQSFLAALDESFEVEKREPDTLMAGQIGLLLGTQWYVLHLRKFVFSHVDVAGSLDAELLQQRVLAPILGIEDPRNDERIDFIGGSAGDQELAGRVRAGFRAAFKMPAVRVEDMLAVADAKKIMPPKSTWFEPKLRDGLLVYAPSAILQPAAPP